MGNAPGFWYLLQPLFHEAKVMASHCVVEAQGSCHFVSWKKNKFAAKDDLKRIVVDTSVGFPLIQNMIFIGP